VEWLRLFLGRCAIVPSSRDLVLKWADVMVAARRIGRRIETVDGWIAATALLYDAPLLTHNKSDYVGVQGLRIVDD
jgi:tRNA(fMet)-specific endonuclease VapC